MGTRLRLRCDASMVFSQPARRPDAVVSPDHQVCQHVAAVIEGKPNVPLSQSDNENARNLVTLDQDLTIALGDLSPAASGYARRRPFLLSEAITRECHCGFMPGNSKSSLRGQWVFGVRNEQGEALAWIGRNVRYDEEYAKWTAGGRQGCEPMKYRFPNQALFRRGLELYGQEFLGDERFDTSLQEYVMRSDAQFLALAVIVGMVQGGTQALSRSLFASLIPKQKSTQFSALFALSEKLAGILGPGLFVATISLTGSSRYAIVSVIILFLVGGFLLSRVDVALGRATVEIAEPFAKQTATVQSQA